MVRVGIQGYAVPADERQDVALTFVIDVSGSMDMDNRLGLAKRALYLNWSTTAPDRPKWPSWSTAMRPHRAAHDAGQREAGDPERHQPAGAGRFDQRRRRSLAGRIAWRRQNFDPEP
jgi:hypothetical protein